MTANIALSIAQWRRHAVAPRRGPPAQTNRCHENLYFTRMNINGAAKQTENNKSINLTININGQQIQHDEVGNT